MAVSWERAFRLYLVLKERERHTHTCHKLTTLYHSALLLKHRIRNVIWRQYLDLPAKILCSINHLKQFLPLLLIQSFRICNRKLAGTLNKAHRNTTPPHPFTCYSETLYSISHSQWTEGSSINHRTYISKDKRPQYQLLKVQKLYSEGLEALMADLGQVLDRLHLFPCSIPLFE